MTKNTLPQEPEVAELKKQTDVEWLMKSGIDEKPKELMFFFFYLFMSLFLPLFFFGTVCVYETQLQLPRR